MSFDETCAAPTYASERPAGPVALPGETTKIGALPYNVAALLCYVPLMGIGLIASLLWLFLEPPGNKFLRFHAIQGLSLLALSVVGMFGVGCVGSVVIFAAQIAAQLAHAPAVAAIATLMFWLAQLSYALGVIVAYVVSLLGAWRHKTWTLPLIGALADARA